MPYSIQTKDGIRINNIPDDVPRDSDILKQRVADERAKRTAPAAQQVMPGTQSVPDPYGEVPTADGQYPAPVAQPSPSIGERISGGIQTLGTLASGAVQAPIGFVGGTLAGAGREIASGEFGTPEAAQRIAESAQRGAERLTIKPITPEGERQVKAVGEAVAPVASALGAVAPMAGEMAAITSGITNLPMAARQVREIPKTVAAKRLLSEAAPEIPQLKDAARTIYSSLDDAGVTVAQPEIGKLAGDIASTVKRQGFNQRIHPKVSAALDEISDSAGKNMTLTELDTMRKVARAAASSIDPDESRLGSLMVEKIDDFLDDLPDQAVIKGQAQDVGPMYKQARGLWQRAKKAELLEDAVGKAKNQASGFENGLRVQFRSLLNNKKKMRGFTAEEKAAMQKVVQGGGAENALKFLGKFGFTEGQATSMLGSSVGVAAGAAVGGPAGAVAVPLIGQVSKQLAQRLTRGNASFANQIIRSGRDGKAIALSYVRNTPAAQRSAAELTELLMRPGVSLEAVKAIKNPIIQDAAFYAELAKAQAASQSARQENVQQENGEPVKQ